MCIIKITTIEDFKEKVKSIGNAPEIEILEFNGESKQCNIFCDRCKTFGVVSRARYLYKNRCCKNCAKIQNKIKSGVPILESHPEIAKCFVDSDFVKTHTCTTHDKAYFKCPDCGDVSEVYVRDCFKRGFNCKKCGDNRRFPNKFIYNILKELKIKFIAEKRFDWAKNVNGNHTSYDFYIPELNMIIEANGLQHYEDTFFGKFENINENDDYKEKIAKINGVNNYVRLNCSKSTETFIINSIKEEKLLDFIDFDKIDMKKVVTSCNKSLLVECCNIFNKDHNMSTSDVANILNLDRHTVLSYLKKGVVAGICAYSKDVALKNRKKKAAEKRTKQCVLQFDINGAFIKKYQSVSIASKFTNISVDSIRNCCLLVSNSAGGFVWKYEDESLLYKVINKNIENVKLCCDIYKDALNGVIVKTPFSNIRFRTLLKYGNAVGLLEYNPCDTTYKTIKYKNSRKRSISQYSKDGDFMSEYASYEEVYKNTGIKAVNIRNSINGTTKSAGGYIWKYSEK